MGIARGNTIFGSQGKLWSELLPPSATPHSVTPLLSAIIFFIHPHTSAEGVFSLNSLTVASSSCCSFLGSVTTNTDAASTSVRNNDTALDSATELSGSLATNSFPKFVELNPPLAVQLVRRRPGRGVLGAVKLGFRLRWRKSDLGDGFGFAVGGCLGGAIFANTIALEAAIPLRSSDTQSGLTQWSFSSFLGSVTTNADAASTSARNSDTALDSATELSGSLATNSFPKFVELNPPLAVQLVRRRPGRGVLGGGEIRVSVDVEKE
ncbi:hypothetical protein Sjap_025178 [Stephania japonica]|uniref:Uncharacterized protein n=1 Tax=Stephania japonica TaxID=461633 RepID=A0AAP0E5P6_9MAGN